jgi:hypothetical protein
MLEAELAVLTDELARQDVDAARTRAALQAWNERYAARRSYLVSRPNGAELVRLDVLFCYIEGLARYVEGVYLVDARYHLHDDSRIDPTFKNFSGFEDRGYTGMPSRQMSSEYYYALGMHIALLLDRLTPEWVHTVHATPDWLVGTAVGIARELAPNRG